MNYGARVLTLRNVDGVFGIMLYFLDVVRSYYIFRALRMLAKKINENRSRKRMNRWTHVNRRLYHAVNKRERNCIFFNSFVVIQMFKIIHQHSDRPTYYQQRRGMR